jgi:methanogenic corrinoid protein MtbC1
MSEELSTAIAELARDDVPVMIGRRLESGEDPLAILDECREGMARVGRLFQDGDYYLAELLLSAEIFTTAVAQLEPHPPAAAHDRPRTPSKVHPHRLKSSGYTGLAAITNL